MMGQLRINLCFDPKSETDLEVYNYLVATDRRKSSIVIDAVKRVYLTTSYWDSSQNERDKQMVSEIEKITKEKASAETEAITQKLDQLIQLISEKGIVPPENTQPTMQQGNQDNMSLRPLEPIGSNGANYANQPMRQDTWPPQQAEPQPVPEMDMGLFSAMKTFMG